MNRRLFKATMTDQQVFNSLVGSVPLPPPSLLGGNNGTSYTNYQSNNNVQPSKSLRPSQPPIFHAPAPLEAPFTFLPQPMRHQYDNSQQWGGFPAGYGGYGGYGGGYGGGYAQQQQGYRAW